MEKGKKKRKIVLNLLSQNSNEIPKKKKKKRTFNSYIIQRERIKESHVRLFKIHAKFEREKEKRKKNHGEKMVFACRTKIARAAGSTKEKIKGRISIVPEKRRRKKKAKQSKKKKKKPIP